MNSRQATIVLFTNKGLDITALHEWFDAYRDDIAIVTERALADQFRRHFAEVHAVDDYFDDDAFYAVANAVLAGRVRPVRALCYLVEADVDRCGRLRDQYGVAGLSHADSLVFRNKHLMKQRVARHVKTPRFRLVSDRRALTEFAAEVGYPVVLKPLDKFGSNSVKVFRSAPQIAPFATPMLAEEFVDGGMAHVDGFMRDGRPFATSVSMYKNGCLAFGEGRPLGSYQLDEQSEACRQVMAFARTILQAMPRTDACMFHLEIFVRPDGELVFCEVAARMGGGHIYDVLNATYGADVVRLWLAAQMGLDWFGELQSASSRRHGFLLVPPVEGTLTRIRPIAVPDYVLRANLPQVTPKHYGRAALSFDRVASFVVAGGSSAEVAARLDRCEDLAHHALVWETQEHMEVA